MDLIRTTVSTIHPTPPDNAFCLLEQVRDDLFSSDDDYNTFALLDAYKVIFLEDRAQMADLPHACLYQGQAKEKYGNYAPWLLQLEPDATLTAELLSHTGKEPDQRNLLAARTGIFLHSYQNLQAVAKHLRYYTKLQEDSGVNLFFRLQEPQFLDALLAASHPHEVIRFFSVVNKVSYFRPSLTPNAWDFVTFSADEKLDFETNQRGTIPQLDRLRRNALKNALCKRNARELAIAHSNNEQDRRERYSTYSKLFMAGFDNEPTFIEAHKVVKNLPADAQASFWNAVIGGAYSLRFIVVRYAKHYNLEHFLL